MHAATPSSTAAPSTHPAPLLPNDPATVGRWRLLGRLGSGGMGTVYLARSAGGRTVALKVVHRTLAEDPEFRARFREEVAATRRLVAQDESAARQERHFAAVVDADPDGPRPWLATEYLLGVSLQDAVRRHGPWPVSAVRSLGATLAQALALVHRAGLVHRDVKPSNVLVTADGPRLVDFGIARSDGAARLTQTGYVVGSPAYMAPEQAENREAGPAADVFALGGVLAFTALGRPPFGDGTAEELLFRVVHNPPDLAGLQDADGVLRRVLERALTKTPTERPTASEVSRLLSGIARPFCELLPAPVLADVAARTRLEWDVPRPAEPPAPPAPPGSPGAVAAPASGPQGGPAAAVPHGPAAGAPSARTTRRALLRGGGALLGAAALSAATYAAGRLTRPSTSGGDGASPAAAGTASASPSSGGAQAAPRPVWQYRGNISTLTVPTLVDGCLVLLEDSPGQLLGLNAADGTVRWRADGVSGYAPRASGRTRRHGRVLVMEALHAAPHNRLAFVSPADGRVWYSDPLEVEFGQLAQSPVAAVRGSRVYLVGHERVAGQSDPEKWPRLLLAYDIDAARVVWRREIARDDADEAFGAVLGEHLVLLEPGAVRAYRTSDGSPRWERSYPGDTAWLTGVPEQDAVLVSGHQLQLLDAATGEVRWATKETTEDVGPTGEPLFGPTTVADGVGYLTVRGGGLLAVRLSDHKRLWDWLPGEQGAVAQTPPTVQNGLVFPPTVQGNTVAVAVDARTGKSRWKVRDVKFEFEGVLLNSDAERLYVLRGTHVRALPLR